MEQFQTVINFLDVTRKPGSHELDVPPSQIWIIVSLEFPILIENEKFILMVQPYYGDYKSPVNGGEGILYPPFTAYPIETGYFKMSRLSDIREKISEHADVVFSHNIVDQLAYNLGLGEPKNELIEIVEEYKVSPREHDIYKFFRVYRYRCWHTSNKGKRNLSDPEGLKGHFFVPMDLKRGISESSENLGPHSYKYLSKPLATQFAKLAEDYNAETSSDKMTIIAEDDLVNYENGIVIHVDVSGYGKLNQHSRLDRSNPTTSGSKVSADFRFHIAKLFEVFFCDLCTTQSRITGDGFVCAAPIRFYSGGENELFSRVAVALKNLLRSIQKINLNVADEELKIGLRLSFLKGQYSYGKIGGSTSIGADFDGEAMIDVARCDQATTDLISSSERKKFLILSCSEKSQLASLLKHAEFSSEVSSYMVGVKEREFKIYISKIGI